MQPARMPADNRRPRPVRNVSGTLRVPPVRYSFASANGTRRVPDTMQPPGSPAYKRPQRRSPKPSVRGVDASFSARRALQPMKMRRNYILIPTARGKMGQSGDPGKLGKRPRRLGGWAISFPPRPALQPMRMRRSRILIPTASRQDGGKAAIRAKWASQQRPGVPPLGGNSG